MSVVELVWSSIVLPTFGHDDDVVSTSERVFPELDWAEEDIRVVSLSLTSGGSVEIPLLEFCNRLWLAVQCLKRSACQGGISIRSTYHGLRTKIRVGIDPNVFCHYLTTLIEVQVFHQTRRGQHTII